MHLRLGVLAWFKAQGGGHLTLMTGVLKASAAAKGARWSDGVGGLLWVVEGTSLTHAMASWLRESMILFPLVEGRYCLARGACNGE